QVVIFANAVQVKVSLSFFLDGDGPHGLPDLKQKARKIPPPKRCESLAPSPKKDARPHPDLTALLNFGDSFRMNKINVLLLVPESLDIGFNVIKVLL
uniref:Uncharacterized protein n=1 Tax=Romanomermis culicivorax TaxID=13658 RepID=A0A915K2E4_ROMCU